MSLRSLILLALLLFAPDLARAESAVARWDECFCNAHCPTAGDVCVLGSGGSFVCCPSDASDYCPADPGEGIACGPMDAGPGDPWDAGLAPPPPEDAGPMPGDATVPPPPPADEDPPPSSEHASYGCSALPGAPATGSSIAVVGLLLLAAMRRRRTR